MRCWIVSMEIILFFPCMSGLIPSLSRLALPICGESASLYVEDLLEYSVLKHKTSNYLKNASIT